MKNLSLNRETLRQLSADQTIEIAAGGTHHTDACPTALNTCRCTHNSDACPTMLNTCR